MTPEAQHAAEAMGHAIAAGKPIATQTEGWSWGSLGIWIFGAIGTPAVVIGLFKLIAAMKKLANEREASGDSSVLAGFKAVIDAQASEIGRLTERIDKLEQEAKTERDRHASELRLIAARHEAELSLQRHATRNAKQIIYGFLDLIEVKPEDAPAIAARMRKRMDQNDKQETEEAASIRGAQIIAAGKTDPSAH